MENQTQNAPQSPQTPKPVNAKSLKDNAGTVAVVVGILSMIGAIITPLLLIAMGASFEQIMADTFIIVDMVVEFILGVAMLVLGLKFKKNGSKTVAKALIVLLGIYAVIRIAVVFTGGFTAIIWAALAIWAIMSIVKYLKIPAENEVTISSPDLTDGENKS